MTIHRQFFSFTMALTFRINHSLMIISIMFSALSCASEDKALTADKELNDNQITNKAQYLKQVYEEASSSMFFSNCNTKSDESPIWSSSSNIPAAYREYSPYWIKFENITTLSLQEIMQLTNSPSYKSLIKEQEKAMDRNLSLLYEYISPDDYIICIKILEKYLLSGAHNVLFLQQESSVLSQNALTLLGYSAALLDDYIAQETLEELDLQAALNIETCEDILAARLAILGFEIVCSTALGLCLPPSLPSVIILESYKLVQAAAVYTDYLVCIKNREESQPNP